METISRSGNKYLLYLQKFEFPFGNDENFLIKTGNRKLMKFSNWKQFPFRVIFAFPFGKCFLLKAIVAIFM